MANANNKTPFIIFAVALIIIFLIPPMDFQHLEFYGSKPVMESHFSKFDFIFNLSSSYRINFPIWIIEFILTVLIFVGYLKTRD
jgi:hypothetical protein